MLKWQKIILYIGVILIVESYIYAEQSKQEEIRNEINGTFSSVAGQLFRLHLENLEGKFLIIFLREYPNHIFWLSFQDAIKCGLLVKKEIAMKKVPSSPSEPLHEFDGYAYIGLPNVGLSEEQKVKLTITPIKKSEKIFKEGEEYVVILLEWLK